MSDTSAAPAEPANILFYWDPICPFAWITSRWVTKVVAQTDYTVDWRFIALRILNKDKDYATEFPPEYPRMHGAGLRMLRVAAAVRQAEGRQKMGELYTAYGESIWNVDATTAEGLSPMADVGEAHRIEEVLTSVGLTTNYASAADDESYDAELEAETEEALSHTGRDVGTPIIAFQPPDGPAFFGPVISRVPADADAVRLWDAVTTLATFPGFAELKRSLREMPQLQVLGSDTMESPPIQDWQGGSRRMS